MTTQNFQFADVANLTNVTVVHQSSLVDKILTPDCLKFLACLHRIHNQNLLNVLNRRIQEQQKYDNGEKLAFPQETQHVRDNNYKIKPPPQILQNRMVEITGSPESAKNCINALNSGANVYMADFEDSLSPTFDNLLNGQLNLIMANDGNLSFTDKNGKQYKVNETKATLMVRTRGLHLPEKNVLIDGQYMQGAIFDFGVYFFHNYYKQSAQQGLFYYFPKLEHYLEAKVWNDVLITAQQYVNMQIGTIKCTVLIETIKAAMMMDEILYELKDHICALNAGRWDYIFSIIKTLKNQRDAIFPDRSQVTMSCDFMRAYQNRIIQVCHKRGAHAIGGMSAFIPSRTDKNINELAFQKIKDEKQREAQDGFDGTWVAHPDLVKLAKEIFVKAIPNQNQIQVQKNDIIPLQDLTNFRVQNGFITEEGIRNNIRVCIKYVHSWLNGVGAVSINNMMEDAATAEISRSQLWQWLKFSCRIDSGRIIDSIFVEQILNLESENIRKITKGQLENFTLDKSIALVRHLIFSTKLENFLTLPSYDMIINFYPKL